MSLDVRWRYTLIFRVKFKDIFFINFNISYRCSKVPIEMVLLSTHNICFGREIRSRGLFLKENMLLVYIGSVSLT